MDFRVVGAGLGRTGTLSLKMALERLLGAPCYHMAEVFAHPEHVAAWASAARGHMPDWKQLLAGYAASVDWPASAFWPELSRTFPDAIVLLSTRDPQAWWESAHSTIFPAVAHHAGTPWHAMVHDLFASRFTSAVDDPLASMAAFEAHNERVRAEIPPGRLLEWSPGDGWAPICAALRLPVPEEPFPHANSREEWLARFGS